MLRSILPVVNTSLPQRKGASLISMCLWPMDSTQGRSARPTTTSASMSAKRRASALRPPAWLSAYWP